MLASLRWTKVLARGWGTRTGTTSLLDAQGTAFDNLTLKTVLGSISLLSGHHLDEAKATRLLGVGIKHDLALLDITVFLEETSDLLLGQARVDTGDEEVGAWVDCTIILGRATLALDGTSRYQKVVSGKGERILTGCRHDRYRWEMQSDGDRHEGCHCDELGGEMRCDHARNGEPRLQEPC